MSRIVLLAALALLAALRPGPLPEAPAPLAAERELASLVPERCLVYVEADGLRPLLELGLDHPFVRELLASELGRSWTSALSLSPADALARADAWLGAPALRSAADVAEHGLALGFDPATKKSVLVARGHDADSVARALALVLDALERQFGWPGAFDAPHARWSGADVWMLGEAVVARRDELLVLGNERELVAEALELAADPDGRGLLARAGVAEHLADRPRGIALWSWLELAALEPFADAGFRALRASNRAPAAQGILGARIAALVSARALSAALELGGEPELALHLRAVDAAPAAALTPLARAGAVPAELDGPGLARALVYRDWGRYFTQRTELFPAEVLPKFAEAVTNGALFFEGQDLGEEVLGRLSPWLRIVSRAPEFAADRRPEIPLPAAAVVAVLDDERAGEAWTAAFQSIVSIVNVDRAQKGQPSLRLHLESEGAVEISTARFAAPAPGEGVDVRYNLEPALAVVGRQLVLGTHASLVHALVRELAGKAPLAAGDGRETLELDARGWRELLERNFETLVANKMLGEGRTRAAAEQEIGGLRHALAAIAGARLELGGAPDAPELALELRLARTEMHAETPR